MKDNNQTKLFELDQEQFIQEFFKQDDFVEVNARKLQKLIQENKQFRGVIRKAEKELEGARNYIEWQRDRINALEFELESSRPVKVNLDITV